MADRVLLVDDDANLLSALQRHLRRHFDLTMASGGADALIAIGQALEDKEPFAVVLCDMRMPGMDGIEVLSRVRDMAPETVRMMLTGNADQQTAIAAINRGNIFRFLTKPCATEQLIEGLQAAAEQYRLVTAERELLEKTLAGSIKVLVDIVSLNDPVAYCRAAGLREWVRLFVARNSLPFRWQLEVAAMVLPIGQLTIPPEIVARKRDGAPLTESERWLFERAPEAARNLIANIPRLGRVAEAVYLQDRGFDGSGFPADGPTGQDIPFDARLLKILKDLSEVAEGGEPTAAAFAALERNIGQYDPQLLTLVRASLKADESSVPPAVMELDLASLKPGHLVLSDIHLNDGRLVLAANSRLSEAQIERLRNLHRIFTFEEPIRVRL